MSKSLWFPFYTADFLSSPDVQDMEAHEVGAYVLLLARSWQSDSPGYLENDEQAIRRAARLNAAQWAESRTIILKKWPLVEGNEALRHNRRLVHEAETAVELREKKAEAGRKSAERRAQQATQRQQSANTNPTPVEPEATGVDQNPNQLQPQLQLQSTKVDSKDAGEASSQPAAGQRESTKFFPDAAQVFSLAGFRAFVEKMNFGHIDRGFYLPDIQRKAELTKQERDETGWENFVLDFLKREAAAQKLLLRELGGPGTRTGVHAPQSPNAPNHKARPEVQAQKDAEFEAQKQLKIAANLARNAADGLSLQPQPGGLARTI